MSMSLEDLLAKEGFRGRKLKSTTHRASFSSEPSTHTFRDHHKSRSSTSSGLKKTERTRSDIIPPHYSTSSEFPKIDRANGRRREKLDQGSSLKGKSPEITEVEIQSDNKYKNIYPNQLYSPNKHRLARTSYIDDYRKNRKSLDENRARKKADVAVQETGQLALDEAAVKAIISILSGYIKPFLKDEEFRDSLRHNCFSSLNYIEALNTETKVIENLEEAIEVVERAAEDDQVNAKDLKKALLQLSLITGLNSNEMKDGFTSGISNSKLSACAHLYLSVIYKLQKKDRVSSKHILQVFIESPFVARRILLPELWENVFLPHLSHLKMWYNEESGFVQDPHYKERKLNLLEKVYNEIMDSGTYQFAFYYKDWLTEGVDAPLIPKIQIPTISFQGVQHGGLIKSTSSSPSSPFSPQPMVSKKLYDAVFSRLRKPGNDEGENSKEGENFYGSVLSSDDGSMIEDKRTLSEFHQKEFVGIDISSHLEDGQSDDNRRQLNRERVGHDQDGNSHSWDGNSRSIDTSYELPNIQVNELTLERLGKWVFAIQKHGSTLALQREDALHPIASPTLIKGMHEDMDRTCESFWRENTLSKVPQDFICPLTGHAFQDPVTLETGQNFERSAIVSWFNEGNTTCPVTGNMLERQAAPLTNFILKRVIDNWKSQHCRHLLTLASQLVDTSIKFKEEMAVFILEQLLLGVFSQEEVQMNAKYLVSNGGVGFLIRRFEYGNLEEKTRVAAMLMCCIEADSGCRNQIAGNIEKSSLLELIHSEQVNSRENVVLLLTELICLHRMRDVKSLLSGLENDHTPKTMQSLLCYLQSCTHELRPLVAVLLLHLDLMMNTEASVESISECREEAVDAITEALDMDLCDQKVQANCCRALLILGGRFSLSGKLMTEDWVLKQAGFLQHEEVEEEDEKLLVVNEDISLDDDEGEREEWCRKLSTTLLGDGKRSFLEGISKCLSSSSWSNLDMVRVCLITVVWLSSALSSLPKADEFSLSAFSTLISPLKELLENGERVEHRILASMSLLNFSEIPECRLLLMTIGEEIAVTLRSLADVTWTAKELDSILSYQYLL